MAVNHLERHALSCGFAVERIYQDYGIDVNLYTYSATGELQNGCVYIQVKASGAPRYSKRGDFLSFAVRKSDLETWLEEPLPVVLVVYDARTDKAYFLYVQRHFESVAGFTLNGIGRTYTVRISTRQVVDRDAILQFEAFKRNVLSQVDGVIKHA
jgi:hypothetical protein